MWLIKLIFREDTFSHMAGAFFFTYWLLRFNFKVFTRKFAIQHAAIAVIVGCVVVEIYQHHAHPEWFTWFDTCKDMVMNGIGITLAILAIRGKA